MATQPSEVTAAPEGMIANDIDHDNAPRDIEADARKHGWSPLEDFKGDPSRWVDAETFVKRADEVLPLVNKKNKALERELEQIKRDMRREFARLSERDQATYERARADIEGKMREAASVGDLGEFDRLAAQAKQIAPAPAEALHVEAQRAAEDWERDNTWYTQGGLPAATDAQLSARAYADTLAASMREQAASMKPADFFAIISEKVMDRFGDKLNGSAAPRPKPNSAVAGGTQPRARGGKSFADLPQAAQAAADRFIAKGIIKSRDDYVKTYQWDS